MRFELLHALRGLNEKTAEFFRSEGLVEPKPAIRLAAIEALVAAPTATTATAALKEKLRLY